MNRREKLLQCAKGIDGLLIGDENFWIGGLEVTVASAEGTAVVSVQDGSIGPEGPFEITPDVHSAIKSALASGTSSLDELEERLSDSSFGDGELDFEDAVAMVEAKCRPEVLYYRLGSADAGYEFSEDQDELEAQWRDQLLMAVTEWDSWEEMDTEELAERLSEFGIGEEEMVEEVASEKKG